MSGAVVGINPQRVTTEAEYELLSRGTDKDGNEHLYVQASGLIIDQAAVKLDEAGQAVEVNVSNTGGALGDRVAVANVAFADDEFGWVQVTGVTTVLVAASAAANVLLNSTATDGTLDDDNLAGSEEIDGMILTVADGGSGGATACLLNNPTVGDPV